jgi:hypothetical protein
MHPVMDEIDCIKREGTHIIIIFRRLIIYSYIQKEAEKIIGKMHLSIFFLLVKMIIMGML